MDRKRAAAALGGVAGLVLTLVYDILTNIGAFFTVTGEYAPTNLFAFVPAGVAFTVLHLAWNTGVFLMTLKPMLNVFARFRSELR